MRMPDPNAPECDCRWLENAAEDPHVPITFDSKLKEYHLIRGGELGGTMLFYHCPFCGGRAPKSRRDALFLHVTHEEMLRLENVGVRSGERRGQVLQYSTDPH